MRHRASLCATLCRALRLAAAQMCRVARRWTTKTLELACAPSPGMQQQESVVLQVISKARAHWQGCEAKLQARVQLVPGSFFQEGRVSMH